MILRIILLCVLGSVLPSEALDSNYPIFNAGDDGLPSSSSSLDKLNKILATSEGALKRIEAVDYK